MNRPQHFYRNGNILPLNQAVISLENIDYCYGFGVYENIRVHNGIPYFAKQHIQRLLESARTIDLSHSFDRDTIERGILELVRTCGDGRYNIKILLIGNKEPEKTELCMIPSNPLFIEKKSYTEGVHVISLEYERYLPQAKTLNMLPSYLAHRKAKQNNAYEALLIDSEGRIVEGTKTNFFAVCGETIHTPPDSLVLQGVTRSIVLHLAQSAGFTVSHEMIDIKNLPDCDGAFLTSTSAKVLPVRSVDAFRFDQIDPAVKKIRLLHEQYLRSCDGVCDFF